MVMGWGIFKVYDFIKAIRTPKFLKELFKNLYLILSRVFLMVGQSYIEGIQAEIVRQSAEDLPGQEKFKNVFAYAKKEAPKLKDSYINLLIETLFQQLKQGKII